jgi:hypothetical protein
MSLELIFLCIIVISLFSFTIIYLIFLMFGIIYTIVKKLIKFWEKFSKY